MTTIHTRNPADGAVPPELPPMSIGVLAVGLTDLLSVAYDLPQPHYITLSGHSQSVALQFPWAGASLKALTRWALRFGAELTSEPHEGEEGPETYCRVKFGYYGMAVEAYAFIPAKTASTFIPAKTAST